MQIVENHDLCRLCRKYAEILAKRCIFWYNIKAIPHKEHLSTLHAICLQISLQSLFRIFPHASCVHIFRDISGKYSKIHKGQTLIFHKNAREYIKYSLRFLFHLTKNLTTHLSHNLCAVLLKEKQSPRLWKMTQK